MGWNNPDVPWSTLEAVLSGRPAGGANGGSLSGGPEADGGDSPAWSRKRDRYAPPLLDEPAERVPYAELHCHSNFSFLDGASPPEELVEQAKRLGLEALALTDHDGMYGVVRFAEAAAELEVPTVFGTELSLGLSAPQNGVADPEGTHLLLLARDPEGYRGLCRVVSAAQLRGEEKGRPVYDLDELVEHTAGHVLALSGCRKGAVRRALQSGGDPARELKRLREWFGAEHVAVELTHAGLPEDTERNDALAALAAAAGLPTVVTTAAHYATPARFPLATALAAVRARRSLDDADGWLPPAGTAHLRSGAELTDRFEHRHPGAVARAAAFGRECAFSIRLVAPNLPPFPVPPGETEVSWLRELTWRGVAKRYGSHAEYPEAVHMISHELAIIEEKNFPGYFLIVHDIVEFCRRADILCQGRGSAANSAVCFALGITNVDAVAMGLLFERFLSPAREGYPDIDLDIESGRREEVIQYVYQTYGRGCAAQVANVITYRPRSAVRDVAKALGFSPGQQDAWSKRIERWNGAPAVEGMPQQVGALATQLLGFPRHLGIHSGGMVICDRPVSEVVPVEWARMEGRSVVQWDKDDCAYAGLVKFDLLGLGMLTALHLMIDLVREHTGEKIELHELQATDPAVYAMLQKADSVGVFQVESRAQMATLPRLKPREFYDLVVEVALIRPGPIQGGSVHPYIRRRNGLEEPTYDHPLLAGALKKTLGVPLFQEQLMQIAVDVAGFSAGDADELRRAMGSKRSTEKMERLREPVLRRHGRQRHHRRGGAEDLRQDAGVRQLRLPREPLDQLRVARLLQRVVQALPPGGVLRGAAQLPADGLLLTAVAGGRRAAARGGRGRPRRQRRARRSDPVPRRPQHGRPGHPAGAGRGAHDRAGPRRVDRRRTRARRPVLATSPISPGACGSPSAQAEALATAGAFGCFGIDRRAALWAAGVVASVRAEHLPGTAVGLEAPALPGLTAAELTVADVWATGVSPDSHPIQHLRAQLDGLGAVRIDRLGALEPAQRPGGAAAARAGRRAGHPPAAPGHGGRGHVREPGRRERHAQRHVLGGAVGALPHGGAGQRGPARAGTAGAQPRGGAQPGGRPAAEAGPGRPRQVAGLPVNARMAR